MKSEILLYRWQFYERNKNHAAAAKILDSLASNPGSDVQGPFRYREILSEGARPGSYVLTVLATDYDDEPNARLRYYLDGEKNHQFSLDKESGVLRTVGQLDREAQAKFSLTARVQDRDKPEWECSSQLEILVSDLNDNPHKFTMQSYSSSLAEDVEIGTLVTKVVEIVNMSKFENF